MNEEGLLEHYARIADVPDAVARLRRFILDLAVRGKLAPQESSDKAARATASREVLNVPFSVPPSWQWAQIGDQLDLLNGMAFKPTDWVGSGLRIVRIQNLNNQEAPFNYCDPGFARDRSLIDNGAFLISWSGTPGTSFGAFIWERGPAVLNQHIFRCDFKTKAFAAPFLRLAVNGRLDEMIEKAHGGVGLQHITKGKLEQLLIPLPPLAEQHRIVAKVDELMALCDRLEAARVRLEATRDRLAVASLARLNAPDPETFAADARFALAALPALTTRPDQIKQLRQTVLNLASTGQLTHHWREKSKASGHGLRIADALVQAHEDSGGHRRGNAALATEGAHDLDVQNLPPTWSMVELRSAVRPDRPITYGILMPGPDTPGGVPYVRVADFPGDVLNLSTIKRTSPEIEQKYLRARLESNDILLSIRGTVGRTCLVPPELNGANITQDTARISLQDYVDRYFVLNVLRAPATQSRMQRCSKGVAVRGINIGDVRAIQLPIPPLAEQHRIVAKVDALMALCDRLEASLTAAAATRRRLLDALLAEALAPAADRLLEAAE